MTVPPFVHLHNHTEYSLLDGACRVKDIIDRAREFGMDALALTDHGYMYAAVPFFNYAKKAGIKPIIGCEVYLAPRSMHQKEAKIDSRNRHLVLLAKNEQGYKNLMYLVSKACMEGFYYKPRIDYELLEQHAEGLIALTACMAGPVSVRILDNDLAGAKEEALRLKAIFGSDLYLEIQDQGIDGQKQIIAGMIELSRELGIPLVATNDTHYLRKEDAYAQDVLLCVSTGKVIDDTSRLSFKTSEFYLKSQQEMYDVFSHVPEALESTCRIADQCNLEIEQGINYLPRFPLPEGETDASYLERLTWEGIRKRYTEVTDEIRQRVNHELAIINQMEFPAYFLITADFIQYARSQGIPVGPGRGSAAGSIVAYALGITNIDPLRYNLIFERFLNPERVTMPDIDIDFCIERRQEVIDYVADKYGRDHVAQITTFGTMQARGVVRDVGRALGIPLAEVDKVAKLIPNELKMTIEKALEIVPDLKAFYENNETIHNLLKTSMTLEGLSRHASTHAAGIVISRFPLVEKVPVYENEGQLVTQYAKDELEMIGLLKMDFLGLRNLTLIENALRIIKRTRGIDVNLDEIPFDDQATYELLGKGDTTGVFQLESKGMKAVLRDLKPTTFEDIIALLALYRPGPMKSGMVDDFVNRKHGRAKIEYLLPELEPILKDTYGTILYQEQIMKIANVIAGFTLGQADELRRAMGKKKMDVMRKQKKVFVDGAEEREIDPRKAEKLFELLANFAEYGFNKSHSAAYAVISYQTAYLKANFPVEFMAALISSMMSSIEKVSFYMQECRTMGIDVLVPDVNESIRDFTVVGGSIRFGLGAIRNVGEGAIESIIQEREKAGLFVSFYDLCSRVDLRVVNKRVFESLIKAGALDTFGNRRQMLEALDRYVAGIIRDQKARESGMVSLFASETPESVQESRQDSFADIEDFSQKEKLKMEKEMLGFYITDHPLNHTGFEIDETYDTTERLADKEEGEPVRMVALITTSRTVLTKAGKKMIIAEIEDLCGSCELVIFPMSYEKCAERVFDDAIVVVEGKVSKKNDELKIIGEEVRQIEQSQQRILNVDLVGVEDRETFVLLRGILQENSGNIPVVLHTGKAKIEVGRPFRVTISPEVNEKIAALIGANRVYESASSIIT